MMLSVTRLLNVSVPEKVESVCSNLPRSIYRYSTFQLQPPPNAPSTPAPTVHPAFQEADHDGNENEPLRGAVGQQLRRRLRVLRLLHQLDEVERLMAGF